MPGTVGSPIAGLLMAKATNTPRSAFLHPDAVPYEKCIFQGRHVVPAPHIAAARVAAIKSARFFQDIPSWFAADPVNYKYARKVDRAFFEICIAHMPAHFNAIDMARQDAILEGLL